MAYNGANLSALAPATTSGSFQWWYYRSADAQATVAAAGYITDGFDRGLTVGDIVTVHDTATPTESLHRVLTVSASTGLVNLSAGLVIT
jgi:hypothetical protein